MKISVDIKSVHVKNGNNKSKILDENKFSLKTNFIYTITGENGAGKSTLLNTIIGYFNQKVYSVKGEVFYDNIDILKLTENEKRNFRKEKIRFVLQDAIGSFDPLKKFEYYFNGLDSHKPLLNSYLEYFGLPDSTQLFQLYPYEVSGGMAQRISIVLGLLANPEILILDEPNSAVDLPTSNLISLKLKEFAHESQKIVLIVTQDIKFAKVTSDFISRMKNGKLEPFVSPENYNYT